MLTILLILPYSNSLALILIFSLLCTFSQSLSNNSTVCWLKSYKQDNVVKQRHSLLSEALQTGQCCQTTAQSAVRSPTNKTMLSNNGTVCCQKSYKQDNVVKQQHSLLSEVLQTGQCCQTTAQSAV